MMIIQILGHSSICLKIYDIIAETIRKTKKKNIQLEMVRDISQFGIKNAESAVIIDGQLILKDTIPTIEQINEWFNQNTLHL